MRQEVPTPSILLLRAEFKSIKSLYCILGSLYHVAWKLAGKNRNCTPTMPQLNFPLGPDHDYPKIFPSLLGPGCLFILSVPLSLNGPFGQVVKNNGSMTEIELQWQSIFINLHVVVVVFLIYSFYFSCFHTS